MNSTHPSRRAILAGTAALSLTLVLASCAPGEDADSGPVTLSFWHSSEGATAETVDAIVADFNAAHEGEIVVEASYQGSYDDTVAKISAAVQGDTLPNLVQVNDVNTAFLVDSGLATPVEELFEATSVEYDLDGLTEAVGNYYTIGDQLWSMPFQASLPALYVRNDALDATGVDAAGFPADFDGLATWATDYHASTGSAGLTFHLNPWWFEELSAGAGVVYCTPDNGLDGEPVEGFVLTDSAQIGQWESIQDLFSTGAAFNPGSDFSAAVNAFASGQAAAIFGSSGALGTITEAAGEGTFTIVPFPAEGSDGGAVPGGNSVFALTTDDDAVSQASATFLAYLGSDDVQQEVFAQTGFLPTTQNALAAAESGASETHQALLAALDGNAVSTATAGCHSGAVQSVRAELTTAIEQIVNGADVTQTLTATESAAETIAGDYAERAGR